MQSGNQVGRLGLERHRVQVKQKLAKVCQRVQPGQVHHHFDQQPASGFLKEAFPGGVHGVILGKRLSCAYKDLSAAPDGVMHLGKDRASGSGSGFVIEAL